MSYRLRALVFGMTCLAMRGATLLGMQLVSSPLADGSAPLAPDHAAYLLLSIANLTGTIVALVGIAYAAIAAHRREWSVMLVLAWIASVVGVFGELKPLVYVAF